MGVKSQEKILHNLELITVVLTVDAALVHSHLVGWNRILL